MSRVFTSLFIVIILLMSGCIGEPQIPNNFNGDDIHPAVIMESFELINQDNLSVNSSEYEGKVLIVVFMFTRCPDVCPIVSANVKWLYEALDEEERDAVEAISITVDPWSDDSVTLNSYRQGMSLEWDHFTGELEHLEPVWGNFGVGLKTVASDDYGYNSTENQTTEGRHHPSFDYLVDHSTGTVLVDKNGNQRVWWGDTDWVPELALQDVRQLISE